MKMDWHLPNKILEVMGTKTPTVISIMKVN